MRRQALGIILLLTLGPIVELAHLLNHSHQVCPEHLTIEEFEDGAAVPDHELGSLVDGSDRSHHSCDVWGAFFKKTSISNQLFILRADSLAFVPVVTISVFSRSSSLIQLAPKNSPPSFA